MTQTFIELASGIRRYQPGQSPRMARRGHASSIRSSNSPPNLPTPAPIPEERLVALKFVLHLVGDLHQPFMRPTITMPVEIENASSLMDSDPAISTNFGIREFIRRLGDDPRQIAGLIVAGISDEQRQAWSRGAVSDWTMEAFELARRDA